MWRRIAFVLLVAALAAAIIENRLEPADGVVILVVVVLGYFSLRGFCTMKGRTEFKPEDDDDGGIDWRESGGVNAGPEIWNGWAVLLDNCAVFEASEAAERLKGSGMRCRLETLHEDRAFHMFGNGGMGTRMCVLVPPSEYARAKEVVKELVPADMERIAR